MGWMGGMGDKSRWIEEGEGEDKGSLKLDRT